MERIAIIFLTLYGLFAAKEFIWEQAFIFLLGECCCLTGIFLAKRLFLPDNLKLLLRLALFLQAIGFWFQFQCNFKKTGGQMTEIWWDFVINLIAGTGIYLLLSIKKEELILWFGKIAIVLIPAALLYSRILSSPVSGSYIRLVGGFLTYGLILFLWPFASMFLLGQKVSNKMYNRFYAMPKNQFFYLIETILIILLACINNDFGTAMLVGSTAVILLLVYGRDWFCKLGFCAMGAIGISAICLISPKLLNRFIVCIDLKSCIGTDNTYLAMQSEPVLYLLQNIQFSGPFGNGFSTIPRSIYPNLDTDYIISGMLFQQGIWMVLCMTGITLLFVLIMLKTEPVQKLQNRLAFTIALVFAVNMFWILLSNISILPICGLTFCFISRGSSVNLAFSLLLAVFLFISNDRIRHEAKNINKCIFYRKENSYSLWNKSNLKKIKAVLLSVYFSPYLF